VAVIDYEGSIDGVPFAGGKGDDFSLTLGSGTFIPDLRMADRRQGGRNPRCQCNLPHRVSRAGDGRQRSGVQVAVKEVKAPEETKIDDALAKKLGLDDLATLKDGCAINWRRISRAPAACI
jgi:trigger factor